MTKPAQERRPIPHTSQLDLNHYLVVDCCCFSKIYTLVATRRLMKSTNNNVTEEQAGRKDLMVSFLDCSGINNYQQRMARHKMHSWSL
jgi:hypothetical protein